MHDISQFVFLAKRILRELGTLSETVRVGFLGVQKQISSIRDQQEAADQQQKQEKQRPQILDAELQIPEAVQRQKSTSDNRQFSVQVALAIFTFLAFLAAAIYAGINYKMLHEMRAANKAASDSFAKTLCQMQEQTAASQQQVGIMREQLEAADRPWIKVEIGVDDGLRSTKQGMVLYGVHHTLRNVGRSTATDVFFGMRVIALPAMELDPNWRSPIGEQAVFCKHIVEAKRNTGGEVLFPDTPVTIGGANVGLSPKLFSRSDYPQIPAEVLTEFRVIIFGCVDYQYATSERHHQTGFVYQMRTKNPANNWPPFVIGVDVSADKLEILPYWLGGSYAN